jgi:hypothetical protein
MLSLEYLRSLRERTMSDGDGEHSDDQQMNRATYAVGYRRPPVHTRFKPGESGNPSGRPKGAQNLKTVFDRILREEISLREGEATKKITKAEAIIRGLVVGAMKGDSRSQMTVFRLAEATGQFEEKPELKRIERVIVGWLPRDGEAASSRPTDVPANSVFNSE